MRKINLLINRFLHLFEICRIRTDEQVVYLTFDDGPEPEITEFVIDELRKHNAKATFFCRGDNAEKHPELMKLIKNDGHALGNHTYNHIKSFDCSTTEYIKDVERADDVLKTHLFRPPWGALTLSTYFRLRKKFKIVYWSLISGDATCERFNYKRSMERLKTTQKGEVVLLHNCQRHADATRQLLPVYLDWLESQGYVLESMK